MKRILVVTSEASDLSLLSDEEWRVAAGLDKDDESKDETLEARSLAVSAAIATECRVARAPGFEATLMQETLTETFYQVEACELILSRRHNIAITSVTVDGTALATDEYLIDSESGLLTRMSGDLPIRWCAMKIVVVYKAGFEDVPADLKQAAKDWFRAMTLELERDPYVKAESVDIPGVENRRTELWSGDLPGTGGAPPGVSFLLSRFRNVVVA